MKIRTLITTSALGLALLAQPASAQSSNDIPVIILKCVMDPTCGRGSGHRPDPVPVRPRADETVRADQNALNYFGFRAGRADGQMGRQTRSAIADFQGFMQFPVTGELDDWQRGKLMESYYRAQSGGAYEYAQVMQTQGPRGLLRALNQPQTPSVVIPPVLNPPVEPSPEMTDNEKNILPEIPILRPQLSMAQHCGSVDLLTQANGRLMDASAISDPAQALDEQFCGARDFAMSRAKLSDVSARGSDLRI